LLSACAETSLNEAPVIDLSTHPGQRPPAVVQTAPAPPPPAAPAAPAPAADSDVAVPAEVSPIAAPATTGVESRPLDSMSAPTALPPDASQTGSAAPTVALAPALAPAPVAPPAAAPAIAPAAPTIAAAAVPTVPAAPAAAPAASASGWSWPVDGAVTSKFDSVQNKGIDIAAAEDAPVLAAADGQVSYTGSPAEYGNLVVLQHPNGMISAYAHLKSITVQQGQSIARGQAIGIAGKTTATGAFVHFEIRRNGVPMNPIDQLPPR